MLRSDTYTHVDGALRLLHANDANAIIWFCFECGDELCPDCAQKVVDKGKVDNPMEELGWFEPQGGETCTDCGAIFSTSGVVYVKRPVGEEPIPRGFYTVSQNGRLLAYARWEAVEWILKELAPDWHAE